MDSSVLEAVLIGYHVQLEKLQGKIAAFRQQLGNGSRQQAAVRHLSIPPANQTTAQDVGGGEKADSGAQKKRWAEWHAKQAGK